MNATDQHKLITDIVVATNSTTSELETVEDLLGIARDETGKVEGSSPDLPDRLAMAVRLLLDLGNRVTKAKNVLLGKKEVLLGAKTRP